MAALSITCPMCNRNVLLKLDGTIRKHPVWWVAELCTASGRTPEQAWLMAITDGTTP